MAAWASPEASEAICLSTSAIFAMRLSFFLVKERRAVRVRVLTSVSFIRASSVSGIAISSRLFMDKLTVFSIPKQGEVHLFHVEKNGREEFLNSSEKSRYTSFRNEIAARMFLNGRSAVKEIAGLYTGESPQSIDVETDTEGKPYLLNSSDLHFNLSHSGDKLSLAFSRELVGLDLEKKERKGNFVELAKRFFHSEERVRVEAGGRGVFLDMWTAKEAMLKLAGKGIAAGLEKARILENGEGFMESTRIFLHRFETDTCVGAVASYSPILSVRETAY